MKYNIGDEVGANSYNTDKMNFNEVSALEAEVAEVQKAIADFETGKRSNVAIIAWPLGGKTTLIEKIEELNLNKVTKITFSEIAKKRADISALEAAKRVVLLDNCHFLYMRKPGGFELLYEFLGLISSQNRIFITTWNTYSWKYLNEAFGLGRYFHVKIFIPAFEKEDLRDIILKKYEKGEIVFGSEEEWKEDPLIYISEHPYNLALLGKKIIIPVPRINTSSLTEYFGNEKKHKKETKEKTAENRVFENIYLESKGNPGVALRIWELGLDYPHVKPENIGNFSYDIKLEHDVAFVLSLILSYQGLKKSEIAEMIGSSLRTDEAVFQLLNRELILEGEDKSFRVRPEALGSVTAYLEKLRLVW